MHKRAKEFGGQLRSARERAGLGVRELARRVGMDPTYLSKVERGENPPPSAEIIEALAVELNHPPDALLDLGGKVPTDLQEIAEKLPTATANLVRWSMKPQNENALAAVIATIGKFEQLMSKSVVDSAKLEMCVKKLIAAEAREPMIELHARVRALCLGLKPELK